MLYFAFGSNLNRKQMKRRCKDSKYIGCYSLKNYKLVFRNYFLGGGVADIQKDKNSTVLGAIYKISKKDEKELDVYENFPMLYSKIYLKYKSIKTMTYVMNSNKLLKPSNAYLKLIYQGYEDFNLDLNHLKNI